MENGGNMQELYENLFEELKSDLREFRKAKSDGNSELMMRNFANMLSTMGQMRLLTVLCPDVEGAEIIGVEKLKNCDALVRKELIPEMVKLFEK